MKTVSAKFSLGQLLMRWAVLACGVWLATKLVDGIHCDSGGTLLVVVLLLSFFNALLKPLLMLIALPFIVMTLGVGVLLINALLFYFVGHLVDGFHVAGGWSAIGGALVVSVTNLLLSGFTRVKTAAGPRDQPMPATSKKGVPRSSGPAAKDDVIDI